MARTPFCIHRVKEVQGVSALYASSPRGADRSCLYLHRGGSNTVAATGAKVIGDHYKAKEIDYLTHKILHFGIGYGAGLATGVDPITSGAGATLAEVYADQVRPSLEKQQEAYLKQQVDQGKEIDHKELDKYQQSLINREEVKTKLGVAVVAALLNKDPNHALLGASNALQYNGLTLIANDFAKTQAHAELINAYHKGGLKGVLDNLAADELIKVAVDADGKTGWLIGGKIYHHPQEAFAVCLYYYPQTLAKVNQLAIHAVPLHPTHCVQNNRWENIGKYHVETQCVGVRDLSDDSRAQLQAEEKRLDYVNDHISRWKDNNHRSPSPKTRAWLEEVHNENYTRMYCNQQAGYGAYRLVKDIVLGPWGELGEAVVALKNQPNLPNTARVSSAVINCATSLKPSQVGKKIITHLGKETNKITKIKALEEGDRSFTVREKLYGSNKVFEFSNQRVRKINNRMPINHEYAGKTYTFDKPYLEKRLKGVTDLAEQKRITEHYRVLQKDYPYGVPFTGTGHPDFSRYAIKKVEIKMTGNRKMDDKNANLISGYKNTPDNYTWHHHQDGKTMVLVPKDLHSAVDHTGGVAVVKELLK